MKNIRKVILSLIVVCSILFCCASPVSAEYLYTGYTFTRKNNIKIPAYTCKLYKDSVLHERELVVASPTLKHIKGIETKLDFYNDVKYPGEYTRIYNIHLTGKDKSWASREVLRYIGEGTYIQPNFFSAAKYPGKILKDEPSGYYRLSLCQKFMKFKVVMLRNNGSIAEEIEVYAPLGESYLKETYQGRLKKAEHIS
ncbi:MAG: hypothetical protein J6Y29_02305 [Clostridiales bacterium]|nr:hypothetical protein [Clostridiales bacterium]